MSGTSEKALKHVSSMPELSPTCVVYCWCCCVVRDSKLPLEDLLVVRVSSDSKESLRVLDGIAARGVCALLAALREAFNGDRLGVCALRVDGGGIRSESVLPLRASDIGGDSGRALRSGGVAGLNFCCFCIVLFSSLCGKFSLSSITSSNFGFIGVANRSMVCWSSSVLVTGASHVLLTSLLSASVTNGELGSLWSNANVLSSTRGWNWPEGDSIVA